MTLRAAYFSELNASSGPFKLYAELLRGSNRGYREKAEVGAEECALRTPELPLDSVLIRIIATSCTEITALISLVPPVF